MLSIIIINYNSKDVLHNCLVSLRKVKVNTEIETFVIDNASSEKIDYLETQFPEVQFIYNSENIGFAAANNIGIKKAQGNYILLLNPDTVVNENSFQPMINYLASNKDVGVVGCKIFNAYGEIERSTHSFPTLAKEFFHANEFLKPLVSYNSLLSKLLRKFSSSKALESYWDHNSEREVDHVTGACMMVKREAIEKAGLLDEAFFLYNEEVEWSMRIKKAGYKSMFVPESDIIHLFGHSTHQKVQKQTINKLLVERYRGMLYFFQKHYPSWQSVLLKVFILEGFVIRLLLNYIRSLNLVANRKTIKEENYYTMKILMLVFRNNYDWRMNR